MYEFVDSELYYDHEDDLMKFGLILFDKWQVVCMIIDEVMTWWEIYMSLGLKNLIQMILMSSILVLTWQKWFM